MYPIEALIGQYYASCLIDIELDIGDATCPAAQQSADTSRSECDFTVSFTCQIVCQRLIYPRLTHPRLTSRGAAPHR